jgi:hypothetical protein
MRGVTRVGARLVNSAYVRLMCEEKIPSVVSTVMRAWKFLVGHIDVRTTPEERLYFIK